MHKRGASEVDVWPLLRSTTDFVPAHLRSGGAGRFQVFEVLITWIISTKMPDFKWTVTRVQGDGGVDFVGRRTLLSSGQRTSLLPEFVVVGQCKVRNQIRSKKTPRDDAHSQLEKDFRNSLDTLYGGSTGRIFPKLLIGCLADKISADEREQSIVSLTRANEAPVSILDIDDITQLIKDHMDLLRTLVHSSDAYSDAEKTAILTHFREAPSHMLSERVTCEITRASDEVLTGEALEVLVELCGQDGPLPTFEMTHRNLPTPDVEILQGIEPSHSSTGLFSDDLKVASMRLKFRSFSVGTHDLGYLELRSGDETVRFPLGTVRVEYTFQHKFYWWPALESAANELISHIRKQTRSNRAVMCSIIGGGGTGKTRFVEEIALSRNMRSWRYARLSHNRASGRPMALILDLATYAALGETQYLPAYKADILQIFSVFRIGPASTAVQSLKSLTDANDQTYSEHGLAIAIAALLRERCQHKSLFLHIADMHHAPNDILTFVKQIISLMNRDKSEVPSRLAILIEGRDYSERSPANRNFERQLRRSAQLVVDLPTLDQSNARAFIEHIFLNAQTSRQAIELENMVAFTSLRKKLVARAGGNPMFIVETLKLLVELAVLRSDPRTGLLYLTQRISDDVIIPSSVEDCLRSRIDLLSESDPQLASVFSACAILDDGIDDILFDQICGHFQSIKARSRLFAMGAMVEQRVGGQSRRITYAHEYYYQVAQTFSAAHQADLTLLELLLSHIQAKPDSALRRYDEARLATINAKLALPKPEHLFRKALSLAQDSDQGPLEYKIASQLVEFWATQGDQVSAAVNNTHIALRFGELLLRYSDRNSAMTWLKELTRSVTSDEGLLQRAAEKQNLDPDFLRAKFLLQLGNTSLNQLSGEFATNQLKRALKVIDERYFETQTHPDDLIADLWRDMRINVYDRLGCAHRLEGQIAEATDAATIALEAARARPEGLGAMHAVYDYGRLMSLSDPVAALDYYSEADTILTTCEGDHARHIKMNDVSRLSAELQMVESEQDARAMAERLVRMADEVAMTGYGLETGAALLNLSAASSFWDLHQALEFAEDSAEWNMDRNYLEMLWKCHHNALAAAQALGYGPKCSYHAQRCYELLFEQDLLRRSEPRRLGRMRRCEPTLRLLAKGQGGIDPGLSGLVAGFCDRVTGWKQTQYADLVRDFKDARPQVECLSNGIDVFYVF